MSKPLSEMTLEELWRLFPVILTEHNENWQKWYAEESEIILRTVGDDNVVRINHIGSTAVPDLVAKPTVDILLEIEEKVDLSKLVDNMEAAGYIFEPQPLKPEPKMMFMKGYTSEGFAERVFHVHVRYEDDWDEIRFRDYLLTHWDVAKKYGELKLELSGRYKNDRDVYTKAKTDFIRTVTQLARNR